MIEVNLDWNTYFLDGNIDSVFVQSQVHVLKLSINFTCNIKGIVK